MSDATEPGVWAGLVLAVTGLLGAIAVLFGARKDRDASVIQSARLAMRMAASEREQTAQTRLERDSCAKQLRAMDDRVRELERRLASLMDELAVRDQRIALLEHAQVIARDMLHYLMRTDSTPPHGIHPGEVRAAIESQS